MSPAVFLKMFLASVAAPLGTYPQGMNVKMFVKCDSIDDIQYFKGIWFNFAP